jgi:DNA modification methylase
MTRKNGRCLRTIDGNLYRVLADRESEEQLDDLPGFFLSPVGLYANGCPTFEQWEAAGRALRSIEGSVHWWIGDWLNYGERAYGDKYKEALKATGLEYQTLRDDKWVAGKIELSRRRDNLPFFHHKDVAALPPDEQDSWLKLAEEGSDGKKWSREKLRLEIKQHRLQRKAQAEVRTITFQGERYQIACRDCIEWFNEQPEGSLDLVFGSPPYENARLYLEGGSDPGIARDTEEWAAWMVKVYVAALRACKGLVAFVVDGQTTDYRWSAGPALLMADLHREGIHLRKPPIFHRVGIPGSGGTKNQHAAEGGGPDWLRNDYEFIICATRGGPLPWADGSAMGQAPRFAPGGKPSHRQQDGSRVNRDGYASMEERNNLGPHRARQRAGRIYQPPERANPGNVIHCAVGGGAMGNDLAHKNEAPFPESLAEFFILSFCPVNGTVADPFMGSGTTLAVALRTGRKSKGCDLRASQVELTQRRLLGETPSLFAMEEVSNGEWRPR